MATASIIRPLTRTNPGYIASRFYPMNVVGTNTTVAVGTFGTVIYLTPFAAIDYPLTAVSLNVRCVTGAASSAVKMAVFANDPATGRPTGTAVVGSNTGQSTASSGTTPTIAVSYTFPVGVVFWAGFAFGTAAPTMLAHSATANPNASLVGVSAISTNNVPSGVTAPFTYSNDIMALDLTGATFTDALGAVGIPVLWVGT